METASTTPTVPRLIFRQGKQLILRPLNKTSDLATCVRWINDPEVTDWVASYLPTSEQSEEQWFDNLAKRHDDIVLAMETIDGQFIGLTGLHRINWKDRTATTGSLIGEKDRWGKGLGTEAKMLLLNYGFNTLGLHKINSEVIEFNERSRKHLEKCGYQYEGCRRQNIFKDGRWHDLLMFGVLKEEWQPRWEEWQRTGRVVLPKPARGC